MNQDELKGKAEDVKAKVKQAAGDLTDNATCTTKAWRTKPREKPRNVREEPSGRSAKRSKHSGTRSRSSSPRIPSLR
jgi:hypothetical protein